MMESPKIQTQPHIEAAIRALTIEKDGMLKLIADLDGPLGIAFSATVEKIAHATGRVILSGIGKSGHIARKIASTLASTGTPAIFIHATEASHGDLGMISPNDVLIVLSNSGETQEIKDLLAYSRRFAVPLIAITSNINSTLSASADIILAIPQVKEACSIGLAPTTSTTLQVALGDALAVALLEHKGFSATDFHRFHPGGRLGAALAHIRDLMHSEKELPLGKIDMPMSEALIIMNEKSFGCLGIIDDDGHLIGVITDGDLRRKMSDQIMQNTTGDIMTSTPKYVEPETLASTALEILNSTQITSLFVLEQRKPVGIIHVHDLLRAGVV